MLANIKPAYFRRKIATVKKLTKHEYKEDLPIHADTDGPGRGKSRKPVHGMAAKLMSEDFYAVTARMGRGIGKC